MSITITCEFSNPYEARQASERLKRRGFMVSAQKKASEPIPADPLLVAAPFGAAGGNNMGNSLMAALPPLAGNGVILHTPKPCDTAIVSVLTDDTQAREARRLLEALGGHIL